MRRSIQSAGKISFSAAVAVFLLYYSILLVFPNYLLNDPDTFWHIRTGQWILNHRQVPTVDFYSYTAAGKRWISSEWLSEIFFALAYKFAGWRGVAMLSAIVSAAIIAILFSYLLRNVRVSIAIGWTALTAMAIAPHFLARPHIFSYVLLLIWVIILVDSYDRNHFRLPVLLLVILMVLWANLHGSFTLGLVFLYVFAAFSFYQNIHQRDYRESKRLLFVLIAVTVSAALTPYGIFSALLTVETISLKYTLQHVQEWTSPNFQTLRIHLFLFVGLWAAMAGFGIQLRGPRLVAFVMLTFLALSYTRGLASFFLLTPIILVRPFVASVCWCRPAKLDGESKLGEGSTEFVRASDPLLLHLQNRFIIIPTICLAVAGIATGSAWRQMNVGPAKSIAPSDAIDFVRRNGITGNVFNSYGFGGYLIFSGIPTFVDGRVPPYTEEFLKKYSEAVNLSDIDHAFQLLDEYNVSWIILRPLEAMAKAIARSALWKEVYSDEYSIVFVRR
jgi:hypothetical protein